MSTRRLVELMQERRRAHNDAVIKRWLIAGLLILVAMEIGHRFFS